MSYMLFPSSICAGLFLIVGHSLKLLWSQAVLCLRHRLSSKSWNSLLGSWSLEIKENSSAC
ncbi:unnamed protein product [Nezara viridula]|uniref:Uncharacterized protein n=1 Tax=Nezara viridula TaxID=85310 RepID=A0A9P0HLI8_NEZVI|nr:unnamed protein product [Nezara viridula]